MSLYHPVALDCNPHLLVETCICLSLCWGVRIRIAAIEPQAKGVGSRLSTLLPAICWRLFIVLSSRRDRCMAGKCCLWGCPVELHISPLIPPAPAASPPAKSTPPPTPCSRTLSL